MKNRLNMNVETDKFRRETATCRRVVGYKANQNGGLPSKYYIKQKTKGRKRLTMFQTTVKSP